MLCPSQDMGDLRNVEWDAIPIPGPDGISKRAFARAKKDEIVLTEYSPYLLDRDISGMLLRDRDHMACAELADDYMRYCYLRRFSDVGVLRDAITRGVEGKDYFAYADGWDDARGRYLGLRLGERPVVDMRSGLVVRREKALEQIAFTPEPGPGPTPGPSPQPGPAPGPGPSPDPIPTPDEPKPLPHDVELEAQLDRLSAGMQVGTIIEEILQRLYDLGGTDADLTFEAFVHVPDGIDERTSGVIKENAKTLGVTIDIR